MPFGRNRGQLDCPGAPVERGYNSQKSMPMLWDLSLGPSSNKNRAIKLGAGDGTHPNAILATDAKTSKLTIADGLLFGPVGRRPYEPDNWVLRLHDAGGKGPDGVWALRLVVDHNAPHSKRKTRSSFVVDQRDDQNWGSTSEIWWLKDVQSRVKFEDELRFDKAGFLGTLTGGGEGQGLAPRYHLCTNIFRLAGYVTDGGKHGTTPSGPLEAILGGIAQWKHLLKIIPFSPQPNIGLIKNPDSPCGTIDTVATTSEKVAGTTTSRDGDNYGELCLWSDVLFYQDPTHWGPLGIDDKTDACPSGTIAYGGLLWSNRKPVPVSDQLMADPPNADTGKKESEQEDSPEFPRKNRKLWVRPWIRVPSPKVASGTTYTPGSGTAPPAAEDPPKAPNVGTGSPTALIFKAGKTYAVEMIGTVPSDVLPHHIAWKVYYSISIAPANQIHLYLGYNIYVAGESVVPAPTYRKQVITSGMMPAVGTLGSIVLMIPVADVDPGGVIRVSLWRSKADTYAGEFRLLDQDGILGEAIPSGQGGSPYP